MHTYEEVKRNFINYFGTNKHTPVPSSSLIPVNDSTLLFTNSGMVQFKNIFLGTDGSNPTNLTLACNSQRCIRAGGKHNDLDDVGKDSYHHTFFEMLGSWSFNYTEKSAVEVYFKEKAIFYAWDLLTRIYKLDSTRMYVTYFGGRPEINLEEDLETKNLWLKYLPAEQILPFGMKENFWEMGASGPCGPCSEIHYDRIGNRDASKLVNLDDPTVIEIWNLVFMQYFRQEDLSLTKLESKHVDTGMGLERLVSILQNCTNYQIDLFSDLIDIIQKNTNAVPYADLYGKEDPDGTFMAYRVVADHVRTMIFALSDKVYPHPNERGYVLRKIIRRSLRYLHKLSKTTGLLCKIATDILAYLIEKETDTNTLTTLQTYSKMIIRIISEEEELFSKILVRGLRSFERLVNKNKTSMPELVDLYITYGFPTYLVRELCEEKGIEFNQETCDQILLDHSTKSKSRSKK